MMPYKEGASLKRYIYYVSKPKKTPSGHLSAINCIGNSPAEVLKSMMQTKQLFGKEDGRQFYDLCQTFEPGEDLSPELAHGLALELANKFFGTDYEIYIATHEDKEYLHSHIIINSVGLNGFKLNSTRELLKNIKSFNDAQLKKHDLLTLADLKRQHRSAVKTLSVIEEEGRISNKSIVKKTLSSCLYSSRSLSEFMSKLRKEGIDLQITANNTLYKYQNRYYGEKALGKDFSVHNICAFYGKKETYHAKLIKIIEQARIRSSSFEEFIDRLQNHVQVDVRGGQTISVHIGKQAPVRLDSLGFSPAFLKHYFECKEEYSVIENSFKNATGTIEEKIKKLNKRGIINYHDISDKYYFINYKKIAAENIKKLFSTQSIIFEKSNLAKIIYRQLSRCTDYMEMSSTYGYKVIPLKKEVLFINENSHFIIKKNKVEDIFMNNKIRRRFYDAIKQSQSLEEFCNLSGLEFDSSSKKFTFEGKSILPFGSINRHGRNAFDFIAVMNRIDDNNYYKNEIRSYRSDLRNEVWRNLGRSNSFDSFVKKLSIHHQLAFDSEGEIIYYHPDYNEYFRLSELGSNPKTLSTENIMEYFSTSSPEILENIAKALFRTGAYQKSESGYNAFDLEYYKRKAEEEKKQKHGL